MERVIPITPAGSLFDSSPDFVAAAKSAIQFLHQKLGFNLWMVTRTEGADWIVLQTEDHGYGVEPHTVFRWADSFCSHMVLDKGPRLAPSSAEVPVYASAPIAKQVPIGAYIGVPLNYTDGSLFGTLCAIHPEPKLELQPSDLPLVELLAGMLSSLLNAEIKAAEGTRKAELAAEEAELDSLTGLYNRRGWERLVASEEERCRRYGHPVSVIAIDLDGLKKANDTLGHAAGDDLIRRAGDALRAGVRESDIVARVGGDEFLVLGVECDSQSAGVLYSRIEREFARAGVSASIGSATRVPGNLIALATEEADKAMYECKARRKAR